MLIEVAQDGPLPASQRMAWRADATRGDTAVTRDWGALVDLLRERLGDGRVIRRTWFDTHVPDQACCVTSPVHVRVSPPVQIDHDRPTRLMAPMQVGVRLPDSRGSGELRHGARRWPLVEAIGPERIEWPWWSDDLAREGDVECRDYWRACRGDGQWIWVYRRGTSWFLQGAWL